MEFDIELYGILDPEHCNNCNLADLARTAVDNGATILQYRAKQKSTCEMISDVSEIKDAIDHSDVKLIVNDRVDVALAADADGVHLGQSDMHAADARSLLGADKIIGLSIKTLEDAKSASIDLIDYAFIGGVFDTNTKDNPPGIGIDGWKQRAEILKEKAPAMPLGAIAGITQENVAQLFANGVEGVALISHLFKAENVAEATKNMHDTIQEAKAKL